MIQKKYLVRRKSSGSALMLGRVDTKSTTLKIRCLYTLSLSARRSASAHSIRNAFEFHSVSAADGPRHAASVAIVIVEGLFAARELLDAAGGLGLGRGRVTALALALALAFPLALALSVALLALLALLPGDVVLQRHRLSVDFRVVQLDCFVEIVESEAPAFTSVTVRHKLDLRARRHLREELPESVLVDRRLQVPHHERLASVGLLPWVTALALASFA